MDSAENLLEENRRLRRTMRDLVALSTLPAVWTGLGLEGIARSLADVLLHTLSLDLIYIRLAGLTGEGAIEVVRSKHRSDAADDEAVKAAVAPLLKADHGELPATIPDPFGAGTLNVAVTRFGVGDDFGVLVTGSRRADFPTEQDRLLLGVGANQTAIVVQRRRAEEKVHEQQQRFSRFMQHLPGLAWIKDTQGRYVYVNDAAEKAFRTPRADLYGKTDDEVFPPEVAARFSQNDRQAVASGSGIQVVETLEHEDGTLHYSLVTKFPIQAPDGEAAFVGGMAIDITDQRRAEEEMRHSEERFRSLMEQAPFSIQVFSPDGRTIRVNRAWEELWGVRFEQIEGYNVLEDRQLEAKGVLHYIQQGFAGRDGPHPGHPVRPERHDPRHHAARRPPPLAVGGHLPAQGRRRSGAGGRPDPRGHHRPSAGRGGASGGAPRSWRTGSPSEPPNWCGPTSS